MEKKLGFNCVIIEMWLQSLLRGYLKFKIAKFSDHHNVMNHRPFNTD